MKTHDATVRRIELAAIALLLFCVPHTVVGASFARGTIAGKVFDKDTASLVSNVTIDAYALSSDEAFRAVTDARGSFHLENTPASVYTFALRVDGKEYTIQDVFDVRMAMPFLLESCFEIDASTTSAYVLNECQSGFVEEGRVATLGAHRMVRMRQQPRLSQDPAGAAPQTSPGATPAPVPVGGSTDLPLGALPEEIVHEELQCLTYEHFPLVAAEIAPGDQVQVSRVYFRSDKYPDFYYVDMETSAVNDFTAVLPKPSDETERIFYYVESLDIEVNSLQTPEFDPPILAADACRERGGTWFDGDEPAIIVGATQAGALAIPPGFSAAGITGFVSSLGVLTTVGGVAAAGGAAGSAGVVLAVSAGAVAAGTGVVVAVTGESEASGPQ